MRNSDRQSVAPGSDYPLSPQLFERFRAFLFDQSGIYFQDNKRLLLKARLQHRLLQLHLPSFEDYYDYLTAPSNRSEIPHMINSVTINETYFFRAPEHVQLIQKTLIPTLLAAKTNDTNELSIWCTACSTGDEAYTIALMIQEYVRPNRPSLKINIIGSDIDSNALARAKSGLFNAYSVRHIPKPLLQKYFTPSPSGFRINPALRNMVRFKHINLASRTETMRMHGVDIVLCANVLVYFQGQTKEQVITSIYNCLNPGGYLLIGSSETLFGLGHPFELIRQGRTVYYRKKNKSATCEMTDLAA